MPLMDDQIAHIRHSHDLDHQTGPPREVLRPLPLAGLGVILLPREARLLPVVVDRVDDVLAQTGVQVLSRLLVGTGFGCDFLFKC
jgi:hypothetical protein